MLHKEKYHTPTEETRENIELPKRYSNEEKKSPKERHSLLSGQFKDAD